MFDQLAALLSAAGAVLWLNTDAIHQLQTAPNAVSLAIWILLLGTVSDVLGDVTYADADASAVTGIAVIATSGNGTWQYSLDPPSADSPQASL